MHGNSLCRLLRLAAYRQFTHWAHEMLGRGVRIVIPSCVVSAVRRAFPEESGHYVGFRDQGRRHNSKTGGA